MNKKTEKPTIILGVIGYDSHAIGNRILAYSLREEGWRVVNLGSFASQEDFVHAAIETNARAILVSSLGGHASIDCSGFKEALVEAGLEQVHLYIGGNLAVGETPWEEVEKTFRGLGFSRVAPPLTLPDQVSKWLEEDLLEK